MTENSMLKKRLEFQSSGETCVGYLYYTDGKNPRPCIIMGSGFGGTQDTPSMIAVAERFAEAGFCAFTFDYRHLGESGGEPRQHIDIAGQQQDFLAAIKFIKENPLVDENKLGLWGTSLGGGHVVSVAAVSQDITAVISQIPYNGFPKKSNRSFLDTMRFLSAMRKDRKRGKKGLAPFYIPAIGKPDELAVIAGDEAAKIIENMQSKTWRNEVAPRGIYDMMKYKPSKTAGSVKATVLVCYGEKDKETQVPEVLELIESLPKTEVKAYPFSHFEFYNPKIREGIISDQIAFLNCMFKK